MYENEFVIDQWQQEIAAEYSDNAPDLDGNIVGGLQDQEYTFNQYWQDRVFDYCYETAGHSIENLDISKECAKEYCLALCNYEAKKEFKAFAFGKWAHIMHEAINAAITDWQKGIF